MTSPSRHLATIAMVFPFIACVVVPLTFFLNNFEEFVGNIVDVVPPLGCIGFSVAVLLFGFLYLLSRSSRLYPLISGLLVGLSLAVWVQSQLFISDFGLMDGHVIDWVQRRVQARTETLVWPLLIGVMVSIAYRSQRTLTVMAQGILLLGILTVLSTWMDSGYRTKGAVTDVDAKAFTLHPTRNKIVIVLDMFQSDAFQDIMLHWPEEVAFLKGFTFYPNAMGGYPTTKASIPLIFTGQLYKNDIPVRKWIISNNATQNIANYYAEKGWGVGLLSIAPLLLQGGVSQPLSLSYFSHKTWMNLSQQTLIILDGGLFLSLPPIFKPRSYDLDGWFLSHLVTDAQFPPGLPGNDLAFLSAFEQRTHVSATHHGEFKFYHYAATHEPYLMNELDEYEPHMPNTRESYVRQARGVLRFLKRKLARLQALGVYDSAEIIVVGDHGRGYLPNDMRGSAKEDINAYVLGGARPLFLYKPSDAIKPLTSSDRPMHLADVVCVLTQAVQPQPFDCEAYHRSERQGDKRERHFFYFQWALDVWNRVYMPPMEEYVINGDVRDRASWKNTHTLYLVGTVKKASERNS